jgi:hypothetical protein
MWLRRSLSSNFSVSKLSNAASPGIILEPGWSAWRTSGSNSSRVRSGRNKNSPATQILNRKGSLAARTNAQRLATAGISFSAARGADDAPADLRITPDGTFVSDEELQKNPDRETVSPYQVADEHLKEWIECLWHCGAFQVW